MVVDLSLTHTRQVEWHVDHVNYIQCLTYISMDFRSMLNLACRICSCSMPSDGSLVFDFSRRKFRSEVSLIIHCKYICKKHSLLFCEQLFSNFDSFQFYNSSVSSWVEEHYPLLSSWFDVVWVQFCIQKTWCQTLIRQAWISN